jgi:hypothetical protein
MTQFFLVEVESDERTRHMMTEPEIAEAIKNGTTHLLSRFTEGPAPAVRVAALSYRFVSELITK